MGHFKESWTGTDQKEKHVKMYQSNVEIQLRQLRVIRVRLERQGGQDTTEIKL